MILFDFDGTLADSISLGFEIANSYAEEVGYNRVERERGMQLTVHQIMEEAGIKFYKLPYLIFLLRKRLAENSDKIPMIPGTAELLAKCKQAGFTMGIVTSSSPKNVTAFIKNNSLESYFSYIKTKVPLLGKRKALNKAKKQLKKDFIYVGDEIRDIEACKRNNIPIVSVPWGFNSSEVLEKHNPGCVAKTAEEAFNLIMKLSNKK